MTTFSQMGEQFEKGTLPPALDELYKHGATPTGMTSPVVTNTPGVLSGMLKNITNSSIGDPFSWFTEGSLSALSLAEKLLTEVYSVGDNFTNAISGEVRNAKGEIVQAKGAYANLVKTLALAGALGGGYGYLSKKKDEIETRKPKTNAQAAKTQKGKTKSGKAKRRTKRL